MARDVFNRWADKHLSVPRWIVSVLYFLFVALGVAAIVIGIPTIDLTTPDGYDSFWGLAVVVTASVAAIASLRERFEIVERWASVPLCAFLITYTTGAWALIFKDLEQLFQRGAGAIVLSIMSFIPVIRCVYMLSRIGRAPRLSVRAHEGERAGLLLLLIAFALVGAKPVADSGSIDLSWLPQTLIGIAAVASLIVGLRNSRRDRVSKQVDMAPPSWTDVYARLDTQEKAIRVFGQVLTQTLEEWPAGIPMPQYDPSLVQTLGELDNTLVPRKLRVLLKPRKPRPV